MKKTKIIIPALGMLLLSTAASVTGTVAWFAANDKVTASGMAVKAKTDSAFLVISSSSTLANETTYNMNISGTVLPTTTTDAATWKTGIGTDADDGTAKGELSTLSITKAEGKGSVGAKDYFIYSEFYIGLATGSSATEDVVKADVTFNATKNSNLNKCFTTIVEIGSTREFYVYNAATGETKKEGSTVLLSSVSETASKVTVYSYFDGQHAACTTNNAVNLDSINVTVDLKLVANN